MGLEPTTSRLEGGCTIQLYYRCETCIFELIVSLNLLCLTYLASLRGDLAAEFIELRDNNLHLGLVEGYRRLVEAAAPAGLALLLLRITIKPVLKLVGIRGLLLHVLPCLNGRVTRRLTDTGIDGIHFTHC